MTAAMKDLVHRQRQAALNQRRRNLLTAMQAQPGPWRTGDIVRLYRDRGWGCCRSTARGDLQFLARHGFLAERGPDNDRWYTPLMGGHR
ncbi:hypothetical protein [Streptomyces sp. NPDC088812]|uniref:hypothetical protein n=1 Tax=Streptomyces sp. NPDC088812 TaxID=3365905 RepID=UPI0038233085